MKLDRTMSALSAAAGFPGTRAWSRSTCRLIGASPTRLEPDRTK